MSSVSRHLRSLLIALAVLALSATVAFAGRVDAPQPTHVNAQGPAAAETPDADEDEARDALETDDPEADETETPEAETPETETDEAESPETETAAPTGETAADHPDNHGKLVSEAAQTETPEGYDTHGAWVRSVARDNHGHSADKAAARQARKTKP
ncbi:MAG TPA: hypothetical protein VM427_05890 [Patescibacteria group bacterium]|nr:hypothetical protein [Patescibacteria group bacterium]